MAFISEALEDCVSDVSSFLEDSPADKILIKVIKMLVEYPPNAVECTGQARHFNMSWENRPYLLSDTSLP